MEQTGSGAATFQGDAPIAATAEALLDRRELALVALERTKTPMVVSDARRRDNPIVLANQAFLDLTGYRADEVIGRNCRFLQGPDTDPQDVAAIRAGLLGADEIKVELLNYRKDGSQFWNQLVISPIVNEAGTLLYYFASQHGVSSRRRAEASERAEHLLLMEVDHRAMNALALVQSFVRLGNAASVQDYAKAVQQRVDALAQAHRTLAQHGWSGVQLEDLLTMQFARALARRIIVSGPPVTLAAKIVQPIALAFHELAANAVDHGALSHAAGTVDLSREVQDFRTSLLWHEHSATAKGVQHAEAFGIGMIRRVIERQLAGSLDLDWAQDGLKARLIFNHGGIPRAAKNGRAGAFRAG